MATEPTAAAMRAAKEVHEFREEHTDLSVALLIDRRTGLPELIAACESLLSDAEGLRISRDKARHALRIAREGRR
jgi:hypothetical protein